VYFTLVALRSPKANRQFSRPTGRTSAQSRGARRDAYEERCKRQMDSFGLLWDWSVFVCKRPPLFIWRLLSRRFLRSMYPISLATLTNRHRTYFANWVTF